VKMPAACCPTVMAGHDPAMTVGRMSVHRDLRSR
jgi:hypothetical protein